MAFKTKIVAELGEWLKEEGFSDEVVHIFEGSWGEPERAPH